MAAVSAGLTRASHGEATNRAGKRAASRRRRNVRDEQVRGLNPLAGSNRQRPWTATSWSTNTVEDDVDDAAHVVPVLGRNDSRIVERSSCLTAKSLVYRLFCVDLALVATDLVHVTAPDDRCQGSVA